MIKLGKVLQKFGNLIKFCIKEILVGGGGEPKFSHKNGECLTQNNTSSRNEICAVREIV